MHRTRSSTLRAGRACAGLAMAGVLLLAACGRSGSPSEEGSAEAPSYEVAQDVTLPESPTFQQMSDRGSVVMGVKEDQPGLGYKDPTTGEYTGFDVEIGRMVAAKLGFDPESEIEYKAVPSASRESALSNGDVDYYVGTYSITKKRKRQVSFAGPYFVAGQDLLVRADNSEITSKDDLKGKTVCSVTGSTPIQRVREQDLTDQIREFQTYSVCVQQLLDGKVDAVTTDDAILKGYAAQDPDNLKVVGDPFSDEKYGVGLPLRDDALRTQVNDILQGALDDGTWQQIYDSTLGKSGSDASKPTLERY